MRDELAEDLILLLKQIKFDMNNNQIKSTILIHCLYETLKSILIVNGHGNLVKKMNKSLSKDNVLQLKDYK